MKIPRCGVCTVCRRLPLDSQQAATGLEPNFLSGLQEELRSLETTQEDLAPVFRYYRRYSKELIDMLSETLQQCFPWEIPPILELVDDLLLYERVSRSRGTYSTEVEEVVVTLVSVSWKKVEDPMRKKIVRMLRVWRDLRVFSNSDVLTEAEHRIRSLNLSSNMLDSQGEDSDEDLALVMAEPGQSDPLWKKLKTDDTASSGTKAKNPTQTLERILNASADPFELLELDVKTATTRLVRRQYRKLCLYIHPDKNPNMDADKCQDALAKIQKAREEAEALLEAPKQERRGDLAASATMCATSEDRVACKLDGCDEPPCRQCANMCCVRNITHCHEMQRRIGGKKCFFHPPPRIHARNA